jgi:hypothetical protein
LLEQSKARTIRTAPERKVEPVTIEQAITDYLANAKARELSEAMLYKLDIFFRKRFSAYCKGEGYKLRTIPSHPSAALWPQ